MTRNMHTQDDVFMDFKNLINAVFADIEKAHQSTSNHGSAPEPIKTCYKDIDSIIGGLQTSSLTIIAGCPNMDAYALALNILLNAAVIEHIDTAIFSSEIPKEILCRHLLCALGKIDLHLLDGGGLNDTDWSNLYESANNLCIDPIFINDNKHLTVSNIDKCCSKLMSTRKLKLVIIHSLQNVRLEQDYNEYNFTDVARNLKEIAVKLNISILLICGINCKLDGYKYNELKMSDLKDTGSIEESADVVIFVNRKSSYKSKFPELEVEICKHRFGPTGRVRLRFLIDSNKVENLDG